MQRFQWWNPGPFPSENKRGIVLGQQCPAKGSIQGGWGDGHCSSSRTNTDQAPEALPTPKHIIGNGSVQGGREGFIPVGCSHPSHGLSLHILNSWGMWNQDFVAASVKSREFPAGASLALISALRCGHLLTDGVVSIPRAMFERFWGDVISYHSLFFREVQCPFWWALKQVSGNQESFRPS